MPFLTYVHILLMQGYGIYILMLELLSIINFLNKEGLELYRRTNIDI